MLRNNFSWILLIGITNTSIQTAAIISKFQTDFWYDHCHLLYENELGQSLKILIDMAMTGNRLDVYNRCIYTISSFDLWHASYCRIAGWYGFFNLIDLPAISLSPYGPTFIFVLAVNWIWSLLEQFFFFHIDLCSVTFSNTFTGIAGLSFEGISRLFLVSDLMLVLPVWKSRQNLDLIYEAVFCLPETNFFLLKLLLVTHSSGDTFLSTLRWFCLQWPMCTRPFYLVEKPGNVYDLWRY